MSFAPTAPLEMLHRRALVLERVRAFFKMRHVLEVDTPILGLAPVTDPNLQALKTQIQFFGSQRFYLQTSPEYYLKRLLAAYPISVYQLGKVFRDDEYGKHHSPEFTMLEWYRLGWDDQQLMDEILALVTDLWSLFHEEGLESQRLTYRTVFLHYLKINPHTVSQAVLQDLVLQKIGTIKSIPDPDRELCLQLLMSFVIEPALAQLKGPVFIYEFPAAQAALACLKQNSEGEQVSGRFEVYWRGIELANGYHELVDASSQIQRFDQDLRARLEAGKEVVPLDDKLLEALQSGLPECAGVALGFDRLMMILAGVDHIEKVLSFYNF